MSLFDEIQDELISETDFSVILRKAKVLAYKLKNQEFKDWIENELNGYPNSESLPKYRQLKTIAFGDFWNGVYHIKSHIIPVANIAEEFRFVFNELNIFQGIKELEAMIEGIKDTNNDSLMISIPSEFFPLLHNTVFHNLSCLRAWHVLNKSQITQIIESTRNSLLNFILELAEKYPQIKSDSNTGIPIPDDGVRQVFNYYILGDNTRIVGSRNSTHHGGNMTVFDQSNQQVGTQYNAAGDINFGNVTNIQEFSSELVKLKDEFSRTAAEETVNGEIVTDVEYELTKAIQSSQKEAPEKSSIIQHLENAKAYIDGVGSLAKVATAIAAAIAAISAIL